MEARMRATTTTAGRPRSVRLDIRELIDEHRDEPHEAVNREEVLRALSDSGIKKEALQGIEIQGQHTVYIVFKNYGERNRFLRKTINLREREVTLDHPNPMFYSNSPRTTLVRIYNFPIDNEDNDLTTVLKQYGSLRDKITLVHDHYGLATGERTVPMEITKDIPSYVYIGKHQVRVRYYQQPQTCRKCYKTGHVAKECTEDAKCRECGAKDHERRECPNKVCFNCGEIGHTSPDCDKERTGAWNPPRTNKPPIASWITETEFPNLTSTSPQQSQKKPTPTETARAMETDAPSQPTDAPITPNPPNMTKPPTTTPPTTEQPPLKSATNTLPPTPPETPPPNTTETDTAAAGVTQAGNDTGTPPEQKQKVTEETDNESESTLKESDEHETEQEYEYDPNEIFLNVPKSTKRNRLTSPKQKKKKARREAKMAMGKSRMFSV
jgi:hypothetical protein